MKLYSSVNNTCLYGPRETDLVHMHEAIAIVVCV